MLKSIAPFLPPNGLIVKTMSVHSDTFEDAWAIAVIGLHGKIPDGSAGSHFAEYIKLECVNAMTRLEAKCLILDFRDVHYRWGNSILGVFETLDRYFYYEWHDIGMRMPIKVLTSDKSIGLRSLLPEKNFFETMESAIQSCSHDMKRWSEE